MSASFSRTRRTLAGDAVLPSGWVLAVAAGLAVAWVAWAVLAEVGLWVRTDRARLEASARPYTLESPAVARVESLHVGLGDRVEAGAVVVQLDAGPEQRAADAARARRAAISRQLESTVAELDESASALAAARSGLAEERTEAEARLREAAAAAELAAAEARRAADLAGRGVIGRAELEAATAQAEQREAQRAALATRIEVIGWRERAAVADREAAIAALERERRRLAGELAAAAHEIERLEREVERLTVRSPVSGTIGQIGELPPGSVVDEGELVATVLPEGGLIAVAHFDPASALGRVRPGQDARLRLHGFPWTQYGTVKARVRRVAAADDGSAVRVELELDPPRAGGPPLEHGLPATAEVMVERLSPWRLLLRAAGRGRP